MGLQNATLMVGAVVSSTGGTSTAFVPNGVSVANGVQIVDSTNTNAVTRASVTFRTIKSAAIDVATGLFAGKTKRQVQLVRPKVLTNGQVKFPLIRIEIETVPDSTDAEITALLAEGAMLLSDSDFTSFWKIGSTA